jgi:hypothetical protein
MQIFILVCKEQNRNFFELILSLQIFGFLGCASPQIANPPIFKNTTNWKYAGCASSQIFYYITEDERPSKKSLVSFQPFHGKNHLKFGHRFTVFS